VGRTRGIIGCTGGVVRGICTLELLWRIAAEVMVVVMMMMKMMMMGTLSMTLRAPARQRGDVFKTWVGIEEEEEEEEEGEVVTSRWWRWGRDRPAG
jgi:hypothetical protein